MSGPCLRFMGHLPEIRMSKTNQRTNGPVNAHMKPEIYTNKLVRLEW